MQPKYSELTDEQKKAWLAWQAEMMESDLAKYIKRTLAAPKESIGGAE